MVAASAVWPLRLSGAQAIPTSAYQAMHWRLIGPFRGGRVLAVAGIPGDPATFYFGAVDGGVWRTRNAGVTWEPLFDAQPIASIGALAVAPSNPRIIYAGTGEASIRSDITFGAGVYRSSDGGTTWEHRGLDDTRHIGRVLVDPRNADIVWVAALGHAYGPNDERGVFRSADGGRTWSRVLYKSQDVGAIDLAMDPTNPNVVFAAMYQARRPAWSQYPPDEGPGSGLYVTRDGGKSWKQVSGGGFPSVAVGRIGLATARGPKGTIVYALVGAARGGGLFRSDDGGGTWRLTSTDFRITEREWYFDCITVDPSKPDVVYVPNVSLMRSTDGGRTFTPIKGAPGGDDYHTLWVDPKQTQRMILGSDQGASVSLDGGGTWSSWYNQPTAQFYHVVTDHRFPYHVYGGQQDAGTVETSSRSNDGSITFREWHPVGAGEAGEIAPDPVDTNIVYGGDTYGTLFRFDRRTGQAQIISPLPLPVFGSPMPQRPLRFTWTSPLVFDPFDPHTLYFGSQFVLRTRDGGLHWEKASPDLSGAASGGGHENARPTLGTATEAGWGVVYTIAPSPLRSGMIWAGTDNGFVHLTTDGGAHWQNVTPAGLEPWSKVATIEASPFDTGSAYAAVDRHRLDDFSPRIYRTRDYGRTWTRIDRGIPPAAYAQVVRADPQRRGLLYAGTELGAFVSFDDGESWQPLQLNLPIASIRDLAINGSDLVAATHGRSFWILDDLSPLRQASDQSARAAAYLYRPASAVRVRRSTSNDTPLSPEEPQGENPPAGAVIDYALGATSSEAVVIEILTGDGTLIRRFSSADTVEGRPPVVRFTSDWLPRRAAPTARVGHNRFVWDLRYPPPPTATLDHSIAAIAGHGTVAIPEGPMVTPGAYQVRLVAGGQTLTQPLTVVPDPRVTVAPEAFDAQLAFGKEIWSAMAEENALHVAAADLSQRLRTIDSSRLGPPDRSSLAGLARRADSLAALTSGADLGALETAVQSADREPTQQVRDAFALLHARLATEQKEWTALPQDLASLNQGLEKAGLPPVQARVPVPARLEPSSP